MNNKNFDVYFDCGSSRIRAAAFCKDNSENNFYNESSFFSNHLNIKSEFQKIISFLEISTKEYINGVNLMIDSPKMQSIGLSITKQLDGSKLKNEDVQFLIQDAKQQISGNHPDKNIIHIIIKNYKIDNILHSFLPDNTKCNLISLDILFICLPKETIEYFKSIFFKLDVSVDQIFCTSYAKSINYKNNFSLIENISFIDIGFNKTSITCYYKNEIIFLDILPIGGNSITKDISKVLNINLKEAEDLKLNFNKSQKFLEEKKISLNLIQQIILARTEEILELSTKSIELNINSNILDQSKVVLTGGGSSILDNEFKEKISISSSIDLLEETKEDICQSGLKLGKRINKQEVVVVPKKQIKQGFFEKLFHFFK